MKKLIYFALVLPMAMLVIACGEKTKSNPEERARYRRHSPS